MDATTGSSNDTDPSNDPTEASRRAEATARHERSVTELFADRADLVGVHPLADLVHDGVRWSA